MSASGPTGEAPNGSEIVSCQGRSDIRRISRNPTRMTRSRIRAKHEVVPSDFLRRIPSSRDCRGNQLPNFHRRSVGPDPTAAGPPCAWHPPRSLDPRVRSNGLIPEIGNPQVMIHVTHALIAARTASKRPASERVQAQIDIGKEIVRVLAERLFGPFRRLVKVARQEVGKGGSGSRHTINGSSGLIASIRRNV